MSTTKQFGVIANDDHAPIPFELVDDKGRSLGTFRATPKPRLDIAEMMAQAVSLKEGIRVYNANILTHCLREFLIKEEFRDVGADSHGNPQMQWVQADDGARMDAIIRSDRVSVRIETLGEIVMWLLEETTGHPTGGSGPSSAGPTDSALGLRDVSVVSA